VSLSEAVGISNGLQGRSVNVTWDVLLTEGEDDHLFDTDWMYRIMRELACAMSVTARMFTEREGAEQHCQVGNSALARGEMVRWVAELHPGMEPRRLATQAE
jgi:hypothetical protein